MAGRARIYEATITWTGNRGQGTSAYTAYGRDHVARAAGKPDLPMSADQAFLGNPDRHNPEDLLVAAISSFHMLWYLHLCADAGIIVGAYEDRPSGRLIESREGGGHFESVLLRPKVTVESGDVQEALRLHRDAHTKCFIANSVNFPVLFEPAIQAHHGGIGPFCQAR
jgi:organic hydroperoxide reductase OsmC/OhrA